MHHRKSMFSQHVTSLKSSLINCERWIFATLENSTLKIPCDVQLFNNVQHISRFGLECRSLIPRIPLITVLDFQGDKLAQLIVLLDDKKRLKFAHEKEWRKNYRLRSTNETHPIECSSLACWQIEICVGFKHVLSCLLLLELVEATLQVGHSCISLLGSSTKAAERAKWFVVLLAPWSLGSWL